MKKPKHNNSKQLRIDQSCLTGVAPKHTHGLGIWGNPRINTGIRADKRLYKAFKPVAVAFYGSTCRALETWMATLIGVYRQQQIDGVSPTNTSIEIGEIRIERNLQPRRKLTRTYTETDVLEMEVDVCCFAGCDEAATTEAVYVPAGEKRRLCEKHVGLLTGECSSNDWRFY